MHANPNQAWNRRPKSSKFGAFLTSGDAPTCRRVGRRDGEERGRTGAAVWVAHSPSTVPAAPLPEVILARLGGAGGQVCAPQPSRRLQVQAWARVAPLLAGFSRAGLPRGAQPGSTTVPHFLGVKGSGCSHSEANPKAARSSPPPPGHLQGAWAPPRLGRRAPGTSPKESGAGRAERGTYPTRAGRAVRPRGPW